MITGVLNVDKPAGMTSHDVVARVRRLSRQKRVGHAGTLDPDATGVLVVCLGHATRLADLLAEQGKRYRATLALGCTTTTEDASGDVIERRDASPVTEDALRRAIARFVGDIQQVPPMVSAVHHQGKRLYELARKGVAVERAARQIRIDSIDLLEFRPGPAASAELDVVCGKGAYIRTLCADIGAALGSGGHMEALRRTRVGQFETDSASSVTLEALEADGVEAHVISAADAVSFLPAREVVGSEVAGLLNGKDLIDSQRLTPDTLVRLMAPAGELLGVGRATGGLIHPEKVFAGE